MPDNLQPQDPAAMKAIADKVAAIRALPGFVQAEDAAKHDLIAKLLLLDNTETIAKLAPLSAAQLQALSADADAMKAIADNVGAISDKHPLTAKLAPHNQENNTTFDKIKKYTPNIVIAAAAVFLGAVTGGLGLVVAGVIVAGVLYKNSADAFKQELDKHAGPKINRSLQFEKDILINHQSINGLDTFKISEDGKLDKKSYLMIGEGEKANLYYINSEGFARKMQLKNREIFIEYIESQKEILNHPAKISHDQVLNQMIQDHVIPDKLQTTRHISKKVIAGIGLALAVAGVLAALPFAGIPMSGVLAITVLGLVIALAAPLIGRFLNFMFYKGEADTKHKIEEPSTQVRDSEPTIYKELGPSAKKVHSAEQVPENLKNLSTFTSSTDNTTLVADNKQQLVEQLKSPALDKRLPLEKKDPFVHDTNGRKKEEGKDEGKDEDEDEGLHL